MASGHTDYAPDITFPLSIQQGGSGQITLAAHAVMVGEGTSPVASIGPGALNQVLLAQGAAADPIWSSVPVGSITGILPIANGGSGTATPALVAGANITLSGSWPNETVAVPATMTSMASIIFGGTSTKQISGGPESLSVQRTASNDVAMWCGTTTDTNGRFLVGAQGFLEWGGGAAADQDVAFFRNAAGSLHVQSFNSTNSDHAFSVNQSTTGGATGAALFRVDNSSSPPLVVVDTSARLVVGGAAGGAWIDVKANGTNSFRSLSTTGTDLAFSSGLSTDAFVRFTVTHAGVISLGTGAAAADTQITRGGGGPGVAISTPGSPAAVPLVVALQALQTGDALQVQDSASNVLFEVGKDGNVTWPGNLTATSAVNISGHGVNFSVLGASDNITFTPGSSATVKIGAAPTAANYILAIHRATNVNLGVGQQTIGGATGISFEAVNDAISANIPIGLYGSKIALLNGSVGVGTGSPASLFSVGASSQFQVNGSGISVEYGGNATVADGLPSILGTVARTGITSNVTSTNIITPPADGVYRVSVYLRVTTAGTAGTIAVGLGWTDDTQVQALTPVTINDSPLGTFGQATVVVFAKTTGAIVYTVTFAGVTGSPACALDIRVEKLG